MLLLPVPGQGLLQDARPEGAHRPRRDHRRRPAAAVRLHRPAVRGNRRPAAAPGLRLARRSTPPSSTHTGILSLFLADRQGPAHRPGAGQHPQPQRVQGGAGPRVRPLLPEQHEAGQLRLHRQPHHLRHGVRPRLVRRHARASALQHNGRPHLPPVGWAFHGLLWVLRKVLEGLLPGINLLHRSLSRQMEFNADLVAVSVAGSDAGIQGLYRLNFCRRRRWGQAYQGPASRRRPQPLHRRPVLPPEPRRQLPARAAEGPATWASRRRLPEDPGTVELFDAGGRRASRTCGPRTRPTTTASRTPSAYYIRSPIDDRSPWVLFEDPQAAARGGHLPLYRFYKVHQEGRGPRPSPTRCRRSSTTSTPRRPTTRATTGCTTRATSRSTTSTTSWPRSRRQPWDEGRLERVHVKLYDNELKEWMEGHNNRREEYRR